MLLAILLHSLYGCTFTISKILVSFAAPIFIIGIRMTIAGLFLCGIARFVLKHQEKMDILSRWYILQIAIFGSFLPYILRYWALQFLPVTKTALLYSISPFVSYFFSYLFFKEQGSFVKWLGLFFGLAGALPMLITQSSGEIGLQSFSIFSWPEIAMLCSVSCFSYGWVVMKKLVMHNHTIPAMRINGLNMFFGGILALMTSCVFEQQWHIDQPHIFFSWLALIILITNVVCFNLYTYLLRRYSATLLSLIGLLAPVSAAITSWFYFGEIVSIESGVSGILVFTGCLMFYLEEQRMNKQAPRADQNHELEKEVMD